MDYLILPLTKGPQATGRIGPTEKQDWFVGLIKAKLLLRKLPDSKILVLSNVQYAGEEHEADIYLRTLLQKLLVHEGDIMVVRKAQETIEQVEIARDIAKKQGAKLMVVSTWLHYLRVRWLMRGMDAEHFCAFGRPRPRYAALDIVFTVLFPILDLLGLRGRFREEIEKRRLRGKY